MIIAKSNTIRNNSVSVSIGSGNTQGDETSVVDPNFSKRLTLITGTELELNLGNVTGAKYVAVHGVKFGATQCTVDVKIGGVSQDSVTLNFWQGSAVFYFSAGVTGALSVNLSGSTSISVDYIAAGDVAIVPNGGVTGGQVYPYLQNNFQSTNTLNESAAPTGQIIRSVAPTVTLSFPNILIDWVESDLPYIYELSNTLGVVSMLDFEGVNYDPAKSWAGFGLQPTSVTADNRYNQLNSISMRFKAAQ